MANFNKAITSKFLDTMLPVYGNAAAHRPLWDESQKMFILDEYESEKGHRYYRGIRFCDRIVIMEKVGLAYNWTYLDGLELYAFNGDKLVLIQKRDYEKIFRKEDFIRSESITMVKDYLSGVMKLEKTSLSESELDECAKSLVDRCYTSFLSTQFEKRLTNIVLTIDKQ